VDAALARMRNTRPPEEDHASCVLYRSGAHNKVKRCAACLAREAGRHRPGFRVSTGPWHRGRESH
jgi:hypothetical protein